MAVDLAGDEPFEAADDVLLGHALGGAPGDVLLGALVASLPAGRERASVSTSSRADRPRDLSRTSEGAVTIRVRIWLMVCVRALTALLRTTRRARIASKIPFRAVGVPAARPERTAVVAA